MKKLFVLEQLFLYPFACEKLYVSPVPITSNNHNIMRFNTLVGCGFLRVFFHYKIPYLGIQWI